MMVAGATSRGKTTWIESLLENKKCMIQLQPPTIDCFYKRWQPIYMTLKSTSSLQNISFVQGISTPKIYSYYRLLYIIGDLMKAATKMRIYVNFIPKVHTIVRYR